MFAIVKLRGKWREKSSMVRDGIFLRRKKKSLGVSFSTQETAFLDTRQVRGGFAAVCISFCGHKDKQGHKVQTKILPTSYLLERIDIWCKV